MTTSSTSERVGLVALVASAGGLEAMTAVLRTLPGDFPAGIVIAQHLGGQGSLLVDILRRRVPLEVVWARDGEPVTAGVVTVCPPRSQLEIMPDRSCAIQPADRGVRDRPLDALLASVADSIGAGAAGVVLTGMGRDAAEGARALRRAGGVVIAQDPESAEQMGMPRAVVEAGAADLVLSIHEIGPAVVNLAFGRPLPRPRAEVAAIRTVFGEAGPIAALAEEIDWARTPVGRVTDWPPLMHTVIRLAMASPDPTAVLWGPDHLNFFNEAATSVVPDHCTGFGRPYRADLPGARSVPRDRRGPTVRLERLFHPGERDGRPVHAWFDLSCTSVRDAAGAVVAVQITWFDRTREVLSVRRMTTLNRLAVLPVARSRAGAVDQVMDVLGLSEDVVFTAAYLRELPQRHAALAATTGIEPDGPLAPRLVRADGTWPWQQVRDGVSVEVADLDDRFPGHGLPCGRALAFPLHDEGVGEVVGMLVLGVDGRLPFDEGYREFLALTAATVAARLAAAHAGAGEQERVERLAELDRLKAEFFANVSDEFQTPLTLLLGSLDEIRRAPPTVPHDADLALIAHHAHQLQRLVGTLLDFSQLEGGRLRANFAETDLARLTGEVAARFAAAAEQAGIALRVDVAALCEPVWVDVSMWDTILSNLLSNALKFTFEGEIEVVLRALPRHVELLVRDTGVGIPREELPHVFKRFHRVRGARARTDEGTGVGLALVDGLVRHHLGRIRVTSDPGAGTAFTVWIPLGRRSRPEDDALPPDRAALDADGGS